MNINFKTTIAFFALSIASMKAQVISLSASKESNAAQSLMGYYVNTVGDVNGDGYSDVIVFDRSVNTSPINQDSLFIDSFYQNFKVYAGNPNNTFNTVLLSNSLTNGYLYRSVAQGDYNGDGISDFCFGTVNNRYEKININFVYGSTGTLSINYNIIQIPANNTFNLSSSGDLNKDGYSDLLCSVSRLNGEPYSSFEYGFYLFHGSNTGINSNIEFSYVSNGNYQHRTFAYNVHTFDYDGDGYKEIYVLDLRCPLDITDPYAEKVGKYRVYKNTNGTFSNSDFLELNTLNIQNNQTFKDAMNSSNLGDVNGDGNCESGLLSFEAELSGGNVVLNMGTYLNRILGEKNSTSISTDKMYIGNNIYSNIAGIGDFNDDLYSDFILSAGDLTAPEMFMFNIQSTFTNYFENQSIEFYNTYVYYKYDTLILIKGGSQSSKIKYITNQSNSLFGFSANPAGDFNGDGYSDFIIGAPAHSNGQAFEGAFYMVYGAPNGGISRTNFHQYNAVGRDSSLGCSISNAGDIDGDGFGDVIIGASETYRTVGVAKVLNGSTSVYNILPKQELNYRPTCSTTFARKFGDVVTNIGDINGDGYSDAAVSGGVFQTSCEISNGRVVIYLGTPNGYDTVPNRVLIGNNNDGTFGRKIREAGDINRDGFDDFLIGCSNARNLQGNTTNVGRVYVYYGSNTGVNIGATQLLLAPVNVGSAITSRFGSSVSGAGDMNGDGFADIIIGAITYVQPGTPSNAVGAAFIYLGSNIGIANAPSATLLGNNLNSSLGYSVAGLGDVNGDGFSDVAVSELINMRSVTIIYGSAVIQQNLFLARQILASNLNGNWYGLEISSAGDLNGDGYSDLAIGSPYYETILNSNARMGRVYIYYGKPAGITANDSTILFRGNINHFFGYSVSNGGDINGDGYSELLVGSPMALGNISNGDGKVFTYFGNSRTNSVLRNNFKLSSINSNNPISNDSLSFYNAYKVNYYYKNVFGSTSAKLVWEVQPIGSPFTNAGNLLTCASYSFNYVNQSNNYKFINNIEDTLYANITNGNNIDKLRVRVKFNPADAINGQIYGPWRYMQGYLSGSNFMNSNVVSNNNIENEISKIIIYPNPANNSINIIAKNTITKAEIYDLTGKLLITKDSEKIELINNLDNLISGIYIVKLYTISGQVQSEKVSILR